MLLSFLEWWVDIGILLLVVLGRFIRLFPPTLGRALIRTVLLPSSQPETELLQLEVIIILA